MDDINENGIDWFDIEIGNSEIALEGVTLYDGGNFRIIIEPTLNQAEGFKKDPYIKYEDKNGDIRGCIKDAGIIHHYKANKKSTQGAGETKMTSKIADKINFAMNQQPNIGKYKGRNITVKDAIAEEIKSVYSLSDKEYTDKYDYEIADFSKYYDRTEEPLKAKAAKYIPTKKEKEELDKNPKAKKELEEKIKKDFGNNFKNVKEYLKEKDLIQ